jgi:hypothetical protein
MRIHLYALCLALCLVCGLQAQSITATLTGTVTDSSGAVVPNAEVAITNTDTNVGTTVTTDNKGSYTAPLLPRGQYTIEVSASGFRKAVREGITLQIQQTARVDVELAVGPVADAVVVTADAMQLETESATLAKVVDNRTIINLPLNTRNVYSLVFLTPGVTGTVGNSYGEMRYSVNGGRQRTMDTLIDGVTAAHPTVNGFAGISVFPSVDAIEEFKLMGADFPAEFGRSLGSVLNIVYKSGTNNFHGTAYEFLRNSRFDANNFFENMRGRPLASFKRSQFGGVFNGPIVKNRTFFLVSYEGLRERSAANSVFSVPTELERRGDFSQTRTAAGQPIIIYDPLTTRANPAGSGFIRTAFVGNVIPADRLDPVALNVMKYYPLPNTTPTGASNLNNYSNSASRPINMDMSDYRLDQVINERQRIFGRYSTRLNEDAAAAFFPKELQIAEGRIVQEDHVHGGVIDYTNTLTPTTILNGRLGVSRTLYVYNNQGLGFVPSSLGLPKYIDTGVDFVMFPGFNATDYRSLGGGDHRRNSFMSYTAVASISKIVGTHTMKFGTDTRMMRVNTNEARSASDYTFTKGMTQGPNPTAATATAGNALASLLLGTGSSGTLQQNYKNVATQSFYIAGYFQDDWRVATNLTLNLGLRWDIDTPRTERYNRTNFFDPKAPTRASQAIPGLTGGLVYVGVGGQPRTQFPADTDNWAPRFGLSWQFAPKTVLRAGYAIVYGPSQQAAAGTIGTMGFRTDNSWVATIDQLTPATYLRDPYPGGFAPTLGSELGTMTQFGNRIEATTRDIVSPHTQQMNVNIQRDLPGNTVLEAAYVMTRGFYLHRNDEGGLSLNQLDPQYLALGPKLLDQVDNPFYGKFSGGSLSTPKITRAQLLRPYPQFLDIIPIYSVGARNWYDSLQVTGNKRFSHGLQFQAAYTWAKNLDEGLAHQNSYDIRASKALADIDVAHRFTVGYVYELPWGRGRHWGTNWSRPLDLALGSWQVNGITSFQTGTPLQITASNTAGIFNLVTRPNNNGKSAKLDGPVHERLNRYYDIDVFSQPLPYTFGNVSARLPDVRNDGVRNFDISLFKEFVFTEQWRLQLRGEALNAFNTPRFGSPNTGVTSSTRGTITSQANAPRQIQFGLKLLF